MEKVCEPLLQFPQGWTEDCTCVRGCRFIQPGVGHGQEKRGQPSARPGSVAEFLNRPTARFLSGQKTPWSVVQAQDFFRIGERVCEGQGFNDRQTDRQTEKEKFLLQIEISMEEYFSLPFSPSPPSSLLLQLDKQPVATHLFEAKILKI